MELAKVGDIIEYTIPNEGCNKGTELGGKTIRTKVLAVLEDDYGVMPYYGQDLVPFEQAKIIKQ